MEIREITRPDELGAVHDLAGLIWRTDGATVVPRELLRVFASTGSYVGGAFEDDVLVGFAVGILARHAGDVELHSHVAGVHPKVQGTGVGFALKAHQRDWALRQGIGVMTWTFDPLVRRNAVFNLAKLGASATDYVVDFYGDMTDGLNAGQGSDRWWVRWPLRDPLVEAAVGGAPHVADASDLVAVGRVLVDPSGEPVHAIDGGPLACATPLDIEVLRVRDPVAARRWRRTVRSAVGEALAAGYRVTGADRAGWYVLEA
jgi:predicted GNAT superfamily acetyltransferase